MRADAPPPWLRDDDLVTDAECRSDLGEQAATFSKPCDVVRLERELRVVVLGVPRDEAVSQCGRQTK
jgi:hypothetical protein